MSIRPITRLLIASLLFVVAGAACNDGQAAGDASSFVALDGDHIVSLVYEAGRATVSRDGVVVTSYAAESEADAMWRMDVRCESGLRGARYYPRALSRAELTELAELPWPEGHDLLICEGDGLLDCVPDAPLAPER